MPPAAPPQHAAYANRRLRDKETTRAFIENAIEPSDVELPPARHIPSGEPFPVRVANSGARFAASDLHFFPIISTRAISSYRMLQRCDGLARRPSRACARALKQSGCGGQTHLRGRITPSDGGTCIPVSPTIKVSAVLPISGPGNVASFGGTQRPPSSVAFVLNPYSPQVQFTGPVHLKLDASASPLSTPWTFELDEALRSSESSQMTRQTSKSLIGAQAAYSAYFACLKSMRKRKVTGKPTARKCRTSRRSQPLLRI